MSTEKRKRDHLSVCLNEDVQFKRSNGFEKYRLVHNALPELDMYDIDLSTKFLGKDFSAPIFISAMTGGTREASRINRNLAKAAHKLGIGMGLGSQRAMIENPEMASSYYVRDVAPSIFLAGNIGASQILELDADQIMDALKKIKADALAVHLNPAQEIAQDGGHDKYAGVLQAIKEMRAKMKMPIIVKEVGCGISGDVALKLVHAGVDAIEVAGAGGTSWIKVDSLITGKPLHNFFEWGIETAECLEQCVSKVRVPIIASGGIRNGIEAAKALALGASLVGLAFPLLKPATKSAEAVKSFLEQIIMELKISMFLVGANNIDGLKGKTIKI